jgi:hypothetical protein
MATKRWSLRQSSSGKSVCLRKGNCDASWGTAIAAHSAAKARAQRAADVAARAEALMKEAEAELARLERTAAQAAHTATAKTAKLAAAIRAGGTPLRDSPAIKGRLQ